MSREDDQAEQTRPPIRTALRSSTLDSAIKKRADGVPTYTVPEAAALLSISPEYLYRLVQAGAFPAVRMRLAGRQGRYVVPAKAVEQMLDDAVDSSSNGAASVSSTSISAQGGGA